MGPVVSFTRLYHVNKRDRRVYGKPAALAVVAPAAEAATPSVAAAAAAASAAAIATAVAAPSRLHGAGSDRAQSACRHRSNYT